jgi:3-hydroxyisobutyrate dehydrogenase-like beta-hydroxyacid dehydrogenase
MADSEKLRIGFVGLGKMGTPMCKHVGASGYETSAYVRNDRGRANAASINVVASESFSDLASRANFIVSALTDDHALLEVAQELASHLSVGSLFVETSTVSPKVSERVAQLMSQAGVGYLRCPVSGSTATAEAKQLTVLASGPKAVFEKALPILQCFSAKQYHVGNGEEARYLKLVLNAMVGATSALVAEAFAIGRSGGIDLSTLLEVVNNSAVASPLIRYKTQMMIDDTYTAAFPVSGIMKDLDIALSVAMEQDLRLPLLASIRETYGAASKNGLGEHDFFVLVKQMANAQRTQNDPKQ